MLNIHPIVKMYKILIVCLTMHILGIPALRLVSYHIPSVVDFRSEIEMSCEFDTEGEDFHAIRWLVNGTEFYRFGPKMIPQKIFHYVDGISIKMNKSNMTTVVLSPLYFTTSGEFRCEASTAPPLYKTLAIAKKLVVIALPKGGPTIEGINPSHTWGDDLTLNCTSAPAYPPADIYWTIDDSQVPSYVITHFTLEEEEGQRIRSTKSGIKVKTDELPFGEDGEVTITCVTSVPGIYRNSVSLRLAKAVRI